MSGKVSEWLKDLGLDQYAAAFEEDDIGWELLGDIDQEVLKDIGIGSAGHRLRILKAINALQPEHFSSLTPNTASSSAEFVAIRAGDEDLARWSRTAGERKPVTMLFADIVGSTALTEKLDAEEAHELLYKAIQCMCKAVENAKGTVCNIMGDGIMAMFGAPVASERHALEACQAAMDMQSSIAKNADGIESSPGTRVQIRVGLHSGEVVVLEVGDDPEKPEYDASGPTVPMAARMEQSAVPGTILMTQETRALAGDSIDTTELPALTVKGISVPVVVYQLQKVLSATELSTIATRHPIVGRTSELAQFRGLLEACLGSGHGQTVFVRSEAGIGKTRLVAEMTRLAQERGFISHKALILDFGEGKGQGAISSLVRSLLSITHGSGKIQRENALTQAECDGIVDPENRVFLNDLLDLEQPQELRSLYDAMAVQARTEAKRTAVVELLKTLAANERLLVVVEDLHWADDITMEYLASLTAAVADCPALMVMTSRAEGNPIDNTWRARIGDSPIVTWDLRPLSREESLSLVSAFIDAGDDIARRCIERAAGNPLFLEQLLLGVKENNSESLPDSIKSLVLSRIDHLPREDKQALRAAAVLGQRFDLVSLRYLINSPAYECRALIEHHLVRPEGALYLFAHALIQEATYGSLLKRQRVELHKSASEWFVDRDLMLHAEHLDRAQDATATDAYLNAAREQSGLYRHEGALQLVRRALVIASDQLRFTVCCFEGELLRQLGYGQESIEAYRRANEFAGDEIERCSAWLGVAEGLRITQAHEELIEVLSEVEKLATLNGLTLELSRMYQIRSSVYFFRGETEACIEASHASLECAREAGSLEMEARSLSTLGDAACNSGKMLSADYYFNECLQIARQQEFANLIAVNLAMRASGSFWKNEIASSITDCREAIERARYIRDLLAELIALTMGGMALGQAGDPIEGRQRLEQGLSISRRMHSKIWEGMSLYEIGKIAFLEENYQEAYELASEAICVLRKTESGMTMCGPCALGLLASATEDSTQNCAALEEAEALLPQGSIGYTYLSFYELAIDVSLRAAQWDEAGRYARALEDYTKEEPIPRSEFFISRARVLAAHGRGNRDKDTMFELLRMRGKAQQIGLKFAEFALEKALSSN
jgi:class 3 adenylate cyclase/tetratricopeptide (TPR) repeat protein